MSQQNALGFDLESCARKVLQAAAREWVTSNNQNPLISRDVLDTVRQMNANGVEQSIFDKSIGLFLVQRKYIVGQFTLTWSVIGFHVTPEGILWSEESLYKRHKDLCNVLIGALVALFATWVNDSYLNSKISLVDAKELFKSNCTTPKDSGLK